LLLCSLSVSAGRFLPVRTDLTRIGRSRRRQCLDDCARINQTGDPKGPAERSVPLCQFGAPRLRMQPCPSPGCASLTIDDNGNVLRCR
jgi:hypothetical protein